ncbi:MAG: hypothetical protein AAGC99_21195, partial [Pseudomonadota bacterium]
MKRLKFWGWGYEGDGLTEDEISRLRHVYQGRFGVDIEVRSGNGARAGNDTVEREIPMKLDENVTAERFPLNFTPHPQNMSPKGSDPAEIRAIKVPVTSRHARAVRLRAAICHLLWAASPMPSFFR